MRLNGDRAVAVGAAGVLVSRDGGERFMPMPAPDRALVRWQDLADREDKLHTWTGSLPMKGPEHPSIVLGAVSRGTAVFASVPRRSGWGMPTPGSL